MSNWQPYPRNRKILKHDSFVLIAPENFDESKKGMPLFCEVCLIRFNSKEDEKVYEQFKCCSACADNWAYSHKEAWSQGWRPDEDKIKKSVEKRIFANPVIVFE